MRTILATIAMAAVAASTATAEGLKEAGPADHKRVGNFYAGVVSGYAWVDGETSGALLGGKLGIIASRSSNHILAIEGDVLASWIEGDYSRPGFIASAEIDLLSSLQLKLSTSAGQFRPYISGGLAWIRLEARSGSSDKIFSASTNDFGWTIGAGAEFDVGESAIGSLGYRYYDFNGEFDFGVNGARSSKYDFGAHAIEASISYRF